MPRDLRPLDPAANHVKMFAAELRKLYEDAGKPKFLQMARKTGKSRTALSEAVGGDHLPSWETVAAFVDACGGEPNDWRPRWEEARDHPTRSRVGPRPVSAVVDDSPDRPGNEANRKIVDKPSPSRRWVAWPYAATVVATAVVASATTLLVTGGPTAEPTQVDQPTAQRQAVITVQNKVALGATELVEDTTPVYLSTEPQPYCASKKCKVEGTEVSSGAMLVATCYVQGARMWNYNLDSSESKTNPNRAESTLWYKAVFPDGRAGFVSEVYIVPSDRGGLGLALCP